MFAIVVAGSVLHGGSGAASVRGRAPQEEWEQVCKSLTTAAQIQTHTHTEVCMHAHTHPPHTHTHARKHIHTCTLYSLIKKMSFEVKYFKLETVSLLRSAQAATLI